MKDVISCDKLRGAANELRSVDFRMGKPTARYPTVNQIAVGGEPPELKHLSRARKDINRDSASSGERTRRRPNQR